MSADDQSPMLIDLIRHGEPLGGRRYRGQTDDPLSEKGWAQMWSAVGDFSSWQHIVSSPLSRCAAFADALGTKLHVPVTYDDRLKEGGFGEWEGKLPSEICAKDPLRLFNFKSDPLRHAPAGAEPVIEVHARVGAAWRDLLRDHAGKHVLVVGHAGVIRMVLSHALGLPVGNVYRINVGNAALTRIRIEWPGGVCLPVLMFHEGRI
jgi:alpha-ribazole phosphatase